MRGDCEPAMPGAEAPSRRIGFFGGSFDPPHCGHLAIARAAAERLALDEVLLAPTGRQPLKTSGPEAPFADRLAMCRLLSEGKDRLLTTELDAPREDGAPNYTVHTLRALATRYPGARLFAIVGADSLPELPRWYDAEQLFGLATWIGVSRPGYGLGEPLSAELRKELKAGRLCLLEGVDVPVSSTEIRRKLHQAIAPATDELPAAVLRYIHANGLYPPASYGDDERRGR